MAHPESRFCVDIVILLLNKMLFEHAEQSELKLIGLSFCLPARVVVLAGRYLETIYIIQAWTWTNHI